MSYEEWLPGRVGDFEIEASARPGLGVAGSYARDPRVLVNGIAYRPTSVTIRQDGAGGNEVRVDFPGMAVVITPLTPLVTARDALRFVDTVRFRGRLDEVYHNGPGPEPEDRADAPPPSPAPLPDFADLRERINR